MARIDRLDQSSADNPVPPESDSLQEARRAVLEGVGEEIAASFPGLTRLGGQIVASLYLSDAPQSMDELCGELGRSKSNVFTNLRALQGAGIVQRRRSAGARHDTFALSGPYPDIIIGAYLVRLRHVVADKRALTQRALALLSKAQGPEAQQMRARLEELQRKYELFGQMFALFGSAIDGPVDLEALLNAIPHNTLQMLAQMLGAAAQSARNGNSHERKSVRTKA